MSLSKINSYPHASLHENWIDLFLAEPTGPELSNFPETINFHLRAVSQSGNFKHLSSEQMNRKFTRLLHQFGRFWIRSGRLYYRFPNSNTDEPVSQLNVCQPSSSKSPLFQVNGTITPILSLAQLKVLLSKYGQSPEFQEVQRKIQNYQHQIEKYVERSRKTFDSDI